MKTLIIIDPQYDFMPGGALEVPDGDKIIPVINKIQDKFDLVIATQDWHPKNHKSFASNHKDKKPFDKILLNDIEQVLWPDHCVQGSKGAEFHSDLNTHRIEAIIRKGMNPEIDSYSGFFDNGHENRTGLSGYLKEKESTKIYFCGLAADICVYYTIMDAVGEEFSAALITDATKPLDEENYFVVQEELVKKRVQFIESSNID